MTNLELGRRKFMLAGVTAAMATFAGTSAAQQIDTETDQFRPIAHLYGPIENLPTRESGFFDDKPYFGYVYYSFDGERYYTTSDMSRWKQLKFTLPKYTEGELPPADKQGQLVYNETRNLFGGNDGHHWHYPVITRDILTSPVTVTNTTAKTLIFDVTLEANTLVQGRVFEVHLFGNFSTASTSDTVNITLELNNELIADVASTGKNSNQAPWRTKVVLTVRTHGVNGEVQPHALAKFNDADADDHEPTATIDTTVSDTIQAYAQWNNAKTGNELLLGQAYMKEVA
jgi:hypothetical protein